MDNHKKIHQREYNYELLRGLSALAVILLHVSNNWIGNYIGYISGGGGNRPCEYRYFCHMLL